MLVAGAVSCQATRCKLSAKIGVRGRPAGRHWRLPSVPMKIPKLRIGIDLAGTKIEVSSLHVVGSEVVSHRLPTPRSYEESLDAITGLVSLIELETQHTATVDVGIPGTIVLETQLVKNANSV